MIKTVKETSIFLNNKENLKVYCIACDILLWFCYNIRNYFVLMLFMNVKEKMFLLD